MTHCIAFVNSDHGAQTSKFLQRQQAIAAHQVVLCVPTAYDLEEVVGQELAGREILL